MIGSFFNSRLDLCQSRHSRITITAFLSLSVLIAAGLAPTTPASAAPPSKTAAAEDKKAAPGEAGSKSKSASSASAKTAMPKVMDFSAEWCAPCKKFAPVFDKVAKNYKDKVEFIHYDSENGAGKTLADKYKVNSLPTVIFMDAKGKITLKYEQLMKEKDLIKNTDALLK